MKTNPTKIIDVSTLIPGPFATFLLSGHIGAKVVKIEDVRLPDRLADLRPTREGVGMGYLAVNSGKETLRVDYQKNGLMLIRNEIKTADIFIHNFKSSREEKSGLSYANILKMNKNILYCKITGFRPGSPLKNKSAHDANILALFGYFDREYKTHTWVHLPAIQLADLFTAYHLALRLMSLLIIGKRPVNLVVSMEEAVCEALTIYNAPQLIWKREYDTADNPLTGALPCYSIYASRDGRPVVVAALETPLWVDFCEAVKRPDLVSAQIDRHRHADVARLMGTIPSNFWFNPSFDFCVTPVLSAREAHIRKYV